ncbi:MAG: tRNA lysidine(34) synthetase TilS [Verrucomicrobiota bacterium]
MLSRSTAPALVAVSGGRDSVVLLHWLLDQGHEKLIVCHLNHGLRGRESGQDAAFVRRLAKKHGLVCEIWKADAAAYGKEHRMSVETAGRVLRHDFLGEMAVKHGALHIYLAHHADDQAETILANICRGTSVGGLAGMKDEGGLRYQGHRLPLLRPLLGWRRADIDDYVREHRLSFREDSSNKTRGPRRNQLRLDVLPLLSQIFERDVSPLIVRLGVMAERDEDALNTQARSLAEASINPDGSLRITREVKQAHPAVLSRVLRQWLVSIHHLKDIGHAEIERALSMLQPGGPAKINLPGDRHLRRKAGRLWIGDVRAG